METGRGARLGKAYCSARDVKIPVLVRRGEWEMRVPSARDAAEAVTCLDYGVRCTGWLCPLFEVPTLPPEQLLEEAIDAERDRIDRQRRSSQRDALRGALPGGIPDGLAILKDALDRERSREREDLRRRGEARGRRKRAAAREEPPPGRGGSSDSRGRWSRSRADRSERAAHAGPDGRPAPFDPPQPV